MNLLLKTPSQTVGVLLLIVVTLIWGTTFPGVKIVTQSLTPAELVAARFLISAILFLPFLKGSSRDLWRDALPLGALLFVTFLTQAVGIQSISSGRAAFITGLNVIFVPLALPFLGKSVPKIAFLAAFLALAGIGVMSFDAQTLKFSLGDLWTLGCAISYAVYILLLDRVSSRHSSLQLSAAQVLVVGILGGLWALPGVLEHGIPKAALFGSSLLPVLYLGLVAAGLTTLLQTVAQKAVPVFQAAVLYSLEPVFAAVFSYWWLGEVLNLNGWIGAGLVLLAMILSQIPTRESVNKARALNVGSLES
jgi:drug/metabolite transporter (DMT)-like permease